MKTAVVTDDQTTISRHFGRAQFYLVFTVEKGQIVQQDLRSKLGHEQFRHEEYHHDEEHHHEHGHGYGQHSQDKHSRMMANLGDCQVLLCGGMILSGGLVTCPVDDPLPLANADVSSTSLPSAYLGKSPEAIVLLTAGKIGGLGPGAGCDGPIAKIARDLRVRGYVSTTSRRMRSSLSSEWTRPAQQVRTCFKQPLRATMSRKTGAACLSW